MSRSPSPPPWASPSTESTLPSPPPPPTPAGALRPARLPHAARCPISEALASRALSVRIRVTGVADRR
eukprot:791701-Rhodomonas_salina.1